MRWCRRCWKESSALSTFNRSKGPPLGLGGSSFAELRLTSRDDAFPQHCRADAIRLRSARKTFLDFSHEWGRIAG